MLFLAPGAKVYEGMIVGENSRDNDLEVHSPAFTLLHQRLLMCFESQVNPMKSKQLTNIRAAGKDVRSAPLLLSLMMLLDSAAGNHQISTSPGVDSRGLHSVRDIARACNQCADVVSLCCACRYIADDELVEVTPKIVRLRKKKLDPTERKKLSRQAL